MARAALHKLAGEVWQDCRYHIRSPQRFQAKSFHWS
jgi:hypothetical protein